MTARPSRGRRDRPRAQRCTSGGRGGWPGTRTPGCPQRPRRPPCQLILWGPAWRRGRTGEDGRGGGHRPPRALDEAETEAKARLGYGARGTGRVGGASRGRRGDERPGETAEVTATRHRPGLAGPGPDGPGDLPRRAGGSPRVRAAHCDAATHPTAGPRRGPARGSLLDKLLRRIEALLACREALEPNVKPKIALDAMAVTVRLLPQDPIWVVVSPTPWRRKGENYRDSPEVLRSGFAGRGRGHLARHAAP